MNLSIAYISFIGFSALVCSYLYSPGFGLPYKILLLFLWITFLNEGVAFYKANHLINTHFQYNLYYYFRFPFIALAYHFLYKQLKLPVIFPCLLFIVTPFVFCINYYYFGLHKLHTSYLVVGSLFIIFNSCFFFYKALKDESILNPFFIPFFWITTGFFFYFLAVTPSLGIINLLNRNGRLLAAEKIVFVRSLNFPLYSLILFDYIIAWKKMK